MLSAMLIPMYFTDFRLSAGGLILRLADIMSLAIIVLFIICKRYQVVQLYLPKGYIYLCFFILYCFVNALLHSGVFKAIIATVQWFIILSTLSIVYSHSILHPAKFIAYFFKTLLVICAFVVLYHFSIGHFAHYKSLGDAKYILALTGVLILSYSYYYQDKRYLLALYILYPFILLSFERKGILAFHLVLILYLCASCKSLAQWGVLFVSLTLFALLIYNPNIVDFSSIHFFEYSEYEMYALDEEQALWVSDLHRQSLLENGWDIFTQHPIFGIGPKMLPELMSEYYFNANLGLYTHNVFLDTLIEQGIVGLFFLVLPYFIFIKTHLFVSIRQIICFCCLTVYSIIMLMFMSGGAPSMVLMFLPLLTSNIFGLKEKPNIQS